MSIQAWLPFGLNETRWAQKPYEEARERLKAFIRDSIERALEDDREKNGQDTEEERMFHSVTAAAVASGKYKEDRVDLVNDLLSLTFAGYDTTAHTLAFCFPNLHVTQKCKIESLNKSDRCSDLLRWTRHRLR